MPPASTALTRKGGENGLSFELSPEQTLKASTALLKHIKSNASQPSKPSLIDEDPVSETPIWLTLTTKMHITSQKTLKPRLIPLPHPLNTSPTTTICLITADPQRSYKDLVASPAFPPELSKRITKVVGIDKVKKKWNQYEAQRKLFAEHDIFLADDRIVTLLPAALGKTFYKSTAKRPIPIDIAETAPKVDGKKVPNKKDGGRGAAPIPQIVKAIEKGISGAVVHLSASTNTAIRIGYASWTPEQIAENVEAAVKSVIGLVPKKWKGVRSIYIKGPETVALPVWLADELWVDEEHVLNDEEVKQITQANISKKRKARGLEGVELEKTDKTEKKGKKQKLLESNDDKLDKEIALRKEKLKKQKAEAALDADDIPAPKASKKSKKSKKIKPVA